MKNWKQIAISPMWFIPVALIGVFITIEGVHIAMHGKYCKTKAQWMNESGQLYDRESEAY